MHRAGEDVVNGSGVFTHLQGKLSLRHVEVFQRLVKPFPEDWQIRFYAFTHLGTHHF